MTWVVRAVTIDTAELTPGEDVTAVKFIGLNEIEPSDHAIERLIVETIRSTL